MNREIPLVSLLGNYSSDYAKFVQKYQQKLYWENYLTKPLLSNSKLIRRDKGFLVITNPCTMDDDEQNCTLAQPELNAPDFLAYFNENPTQLQLYNLKLHKIFTMNLTKVLIWSSNTWCEALPVTWNNCHSSFCNIHIDKIHKAARCGQASSSI